MLENFVMKTPILFFMFNRPHYAIQVFKKIRQIKPPKLFIAVEGPRPDRPDDIEKVQQCRDICKLVDWDCELYTNFAEVDMGCKDHIASRISWAFEYVDELIMMEDDRIPSLSFFPYCQELLEKYRDDPRIFSIAATGGGFENLDQSYVFLKGTSCGCIGIWKRAWQK